MDKKPSNHSTGTDRKRSESNTADKKNASQAGTKPKLSKENISYEIPATPPKKPQFQERLASIEGTKKPKVKTSVVQFDDNPRGADQPKIGNSDGDNSASNESIDSTGLPGEKSRTKIEDELDKRTYEAGRISTDQNNPVKTDKERAKIAKAQNREVPGSILSKESDEAMTTKPPVIINITESDNKTKSRNREVSDESIKEIVPQWTVDSKKSTNDENASKKNPTTGVVVVQKETSKPFSTTRTPPEKITQVTQKPSNTDTEDKAIQETEDADDIDDDDDYDDDEKELEPQPVVTVVEKPVTKIVVYEASPKVTGDQGTKEEEKTNIIETSRAPDGDKGGRDKAVDPRLEKFEAATITTSIPERPAGGGEQEDNKSPSYDIERLIESHIRAMKDRLCMCSTTGMIGRRESTNSRGVDTDDLFDVDDGRTGVEPTSTYYSGEEYADRGTRQKYYVPRDGDTPSIETEIEEYDAGYPDSRYPTSRYANAATGPYPQTDKKQNRDENTYVEEEEETEEYGDTDEETEIDIVEGDDGEYDEEEDDPSAPLTQCLSFSQDGTKIRLTLTVSPPESEEKDEESDPAVPYSVDKDSLPEFKSSKVPPPATGKSSLYSQMKTTEINHPNKYIQTELQKVGIDNLIRASNPAKCCRKAVINEKPHQALPYPPSLQSLPLDEADLTKIKYNAGYDTELKVNYLKEHNYKTYTSLQTCLKKYTSVQADGKFPWVVPSYEIRFFHFFRKEEKDVSKPGPSNQKKEDSSQTSSLMKFIEFLKLRTKTDFVDAIPVKQKKSLDSTKSTLDKYIFLNSPSELDAIFETYIAASAIQERNSKGTPDELEYHHSDPVFGCSVGAAYNEEIPERDVNIQSNKTKKIKPATNEKKSFKSKDESCVKKFRNQLMRQQQQRQEEYQQHQQQHENQQHQHQQQQHQEHKHQKQQQNKPKKKHSRHQHNQEVPEKERVIPLPPSAHIIGKDEDNLKTKVVWCKTKNKKVQCMRLVSSTNIQQNGQNSPPKKSNLKIVSNANFFISDLKSPIFVTRSSTSTSKKTLKCNNANITDLKNVISQPNIEAGMESDDRDHYNFPQDCALFQPEANYNAYYCFEDRNGPREENTAPSGESREYLMNFVNYEEQQPINRRVSWDNLAGIRKQSPKRLKNNSEQGVGSFVRCSKDGLFYNRQKQKVNPHHLPSTNIPSKIQKQRYEDFKNATSKYSHPISTSNRFLQPNTSNSKQPVGKNTFRSVKIQAEVCVTKSNKQIQSIPLFYYNADENRIQYFGQQPNGELFTLEVPRNIQNESYESQKSLKTKNTLESGKITAALTNVRPKQLSRPKKLKKTTNDKLKNCDTSSSTDSSRTSDITTRLYPTKFAIRKFVEHKRSSRHMLNNFIPSNVRNEVIFEESSTERPPASRRDLNESDASNNSPLSDSTAISLSKSTVILKSVISASGSNNSKNNHGYISVLKPTCGCPEVTVFVPCYCNTKSLGLRSTSRIPSRIPKLKRPAVILKKRKASRLPKLITSKSTVSSVKSHVIKCYEKYSNIY